MNSEFTFDLTSPFHMGYIVDDVENEMAQISSAGGITWHPPQEMALELLVEGELVELEVFFTYSKEGPVQIELAQGPKGTFWDYSEYGGPHHNGYWTSDLLGDIKGFQACGFELLYTGMGEESSPEGFAMLRGSSGIRVELIDEIMLPMFETWYATGSFPEIV